MVFPLPIEWLPPVSSLRLQRGEVHLWRIALKDSNADPMETTRVLNPAERVKSESIRNGVVRQHFTRSRVVTRQLFSRYLRCAPEEIRFGESEEGKPCILGIGSELEFNRSHSGEWLLLAISHGVSVGVDLEVIRARTQMEGIVRRWFTSEEADQLARVSDDDTLLLFHEFWTRKEAVLKAWGVGLSHLSDFPVYAARSWSWNFVPLLGYAACLVVAETRAPKVSCFQY